MDSHGYADGIIAVSCIAAVSMSLIMLALLWRRQQAEARQKQDLEQQAQIFRFLARIISGESLSTCFPKGAELQAINHLAGLVRGEDRDRLLEYAESKGLFDDFINALKRGSSKRRIDSVRRLEQFASPTCLAALSSALSTDKNHHVRLEAAMALARSGRLPSPEEIILNLGLGKNKPSRIHMALFRSLAEHYPEEIAELAITPRTDALRPLLVESLGWTGNMAMTNVLAELSSDPDREVRSAAIRAARHLGHPAAGKWIAPMLSDAEQSVRVQAAQACGEMGVKQAIPALERLEADTDWWVRTRARSALEKLQPAKHRLAVA